MHKQKYKNILNNKIQNMRKLQNYNNTKINLKITKYKIRKYKHYKQ